MEEKNIMEKKKKMENNGKKNNKTHPRKIMTKKREN